MPARTAAGVPVLTIYHLEGRRSERLVWLCEELGLPYTLKYKRGDLAASMAPIREINPLMPVAPTIQYGDQVVVESGAIIEMLLDRHGEFDGYVLAILDPDYFSVLLDSVRYAPDMNSALIHQDGQVVFRVPDPQA
mgnify:CR=1 FL=1